MNKQNKLHKKGFSMIELMVVVAIIGVLAAIGIPEYSKFQAKARQSEAKLSLAALFTAEESFRQQFSSFTVDLFNAGVSVQGARLRYVTGFQHGSVCTGYPSPGGGAPVETTTTAYTWTNGNIVNTSSATWNVASPSLPTAGSLTACASATFTAASYGTPASSSTDPGPTIGDTWLINEKKLMQNSQVYLGN